MPDIAAATIVEFMDGATVKFAWITKVQGQKLQVLDENGRQRRIKTRDVLVVHSGTVQRDDFSRAVSGLQQKIKDAIDQVDVPLLWETALDEGDGALSLTKLATLYFAESSPLHASAIYHAIRADGVHFRLRGTDAEPRTAEQVAAETRAAEAEKKRELRKQQVTAWMRAALKSTDSLPELPPELNTLLPRLRTFLFEDKRNEDADRLVDITSEERAPEAAYRILEKAGALPPDADFFLTPNRIPTSFSPAVLAAAEKLEEVRDPSRRDLTALEVFSIDDSETVEIDDALSVELKDDRIRLGVHIADAASWVRKDDLLDATAARRSSSIYLPHRRVPMMPEVVSSHLASLVAGEIRPAMTVLAAFSLDGYELLDWEICRSEVRVTRRLSYEQADELGAGTEELGLMLASLFELGRSLEAHRRENGALALFRRENKIRVDAQGTVSIRPIDSRSPSRNAVSESMILFNHLVAQFCCERKIPIIYRAQDPPLSPIAPVEDFNPVALNRAFSLLQRSSLSLHPQPHAGLGLSVYTQMTSPIRRYTDLVMQRQLDAVLGGGTPPYSADELLAILGVVEETGQAFRQLERRANRYYLLTWLAARPATAEPLEAVALEPTSSGWRVELSLLATRGYLETATRLNPGQSVTVQVRHVDPLRNELRLVLASAL